MSTTLNDSYQSNILTVAQGGSGVATNTTAYGLLLGGTTSTNPLQNSGTGTSGQIYVQAASSIGTWTAQNQIGGWRMITSIVASNSATVDFTGLSTTYYAYKIMISALVPQTNATGLQFLVSSNNGSSYDNSAGNYAYVNAIVNDTGAAALAATARSASATALVIGSAFSSTASANNFEITFTNPATSSLNNGIFYTGKYLDSTLGQCWVNGEGTRIATQVNNACRFIMTSGNIVSGTFKLYGMLA